MKPMLQTWPESVKVRAEPTSNPRRVKVCTEGLHRGFAPSNPGKTFETPSVKALLIEDTLTSATLVSHQLRKIGIEPIVARNGETGIELYQQERPDLILLDIIMPGMDGFEVARRIRQLEQFGEWTPIIFLTARTSDADLERAISVGGDDYLIKPVSGTVLAAKVRAMQRIAQMRFSLLVLTRKLDDANQELIRLSSLDGLTGIANRRQFDETLLREWRRLGRQGRPLSMLLCDVDCFKQFNDSYGHQVGDECLKAVARTLKTRCAARPTRWPATVARSSRPSCRTPKSPAPCRLPRPCVQPWKG